MPKLDVLMSNSLLLDWLEMFTMDNTFVILTLLYFVSLFFNTQCQFRSTFNEVNLIVIFGTLTQTFKICTCEDGKMFRLLHVKVKTESFYSCLELLQRRFNVDPDTVWAIAFKLIICVLQSSAY